MAVEEYRKIGEDFFKIRNKYSGIRGLFKRKIAEEDFKAIRNYAEEALEFTCRKDADDEARNYCAILLVEMSHFVGKFNKRLEGIVSGMGCS